ncbi:MAG TPA: carboxymuconolactone decarboxylase family protein [bacterium]|nr:carboxymuconolactone decarboxylase family protein [bacterium]
MARVPYLDREDLPPGDREIYDDLVATRGSVLNLFRVLAHTPLLLRRLLGYSSALRNDLSLSAPLRELAIITVGRICGASYEYTHHWNSARRLGIPREKLEALEAYPRDPQFSAEERAVLRYSEEATRAVRVGEETFDALRKFLTTRQIMELVQVVAYYNMIVRILEPVGVALESGVTKAP